MERRRGGGGGGRGGGAGEGKGWLEKASCVRWELYFRK